MSRTWDDTVAALRGLAARVPDLQARVAAIAVTGQGDGTWLIDDEGRPVAPALLWLDSRAARLVPAYWVILALGALMIAVLPVAPPN